MIIEMKKGKEIGTRKAGRILPCTKIGIPVIGLRNKIMDWATLLREVKIMVIKMMAGEPDIMERGIMAVILVEEAIMIMTAGTIRTGGVMRAETKLSLIKT